MRSQLPSSQRLLLGAALGVTALLVSSCSDSSGPVATTSPTTSMQAGSIAADVTSIREFPDPASQITDTADLTAYLLPGISGPGAECVERNLDSDEVLAKSPAAASGEVADVVTQCVELNDAGRIILMYAVGFDIDGEEQFPELEPCVQAHSAQGEPLGDGAAINAMLEQIYAERLDLDAQATSSDVAREILEAQTDCLSEGSGSPSPTSTGAP